MVIICVFLFRFKIPQHIPQMCGFAKKTAVMFVFVDTYYCDAGYLSLHDIDSNNVVGLWQGAVGRWRTLHHFICCKSIDAYYARPISHW